MPDPLLLRPMAGADAPDANGRRRRADIRSDQVGRIAVASISSFASSSTSAATTTIVIAGKW